MTKSKENKRITAHLTKRSGGESPARLAKEPTKALFAALEQSWRRLADRFTTSGAAGPKTSETLKRTCTIRMDRTWGCDWLTDRSFGQPVWIVDSGATHHMTGDLSLLDNVIPVSGPAIRYADGVSRSATMKGRTYLDGEGDCMPLEDVYYVPDAKVNLVSVSILVQRGATVSPITRSGFKIRKGGVELRAVPNGGLYTVSGVPGLVKDDDEDDVDECNDLDGGGGQDQGGPNPGGVVCSAEHQLWHARLCHLGPQNMSQMVSKGMVTGLTLPSGGGDAEFCEPCVLAKQHREPFTASKSTPKSGLIHSDLCGPITPLSSGGNAYFLTVLEDESKYSLVYPLKTKDQAPAALKRAVAFFKAQADVTVKIIRTDRGGEFCGTAFEGWMKDEGIVHQKASPYSPQSNGAAERLLGWRSEDVIGRPLTEVIVPERYLIEGHPAQLLFEEDHVCVVWRENPLVGEHLTLEQYMQMGHISVGFGRNRHLSIEDWFMNQYGFNRRLEVITNDFNTLPQLLVGTVRIATMHRRLAELYAGYLPLRLDIVDDPQHLGSWVRGNPLVRPNLEQLAQLNQWVAFPGANYRQISRIQVAAVNEAVFGDVDIGKVMREVEDALVAARDDRVLIRNTSIKDARANRYRADRSLAWMLITIMGLLLLVTASGIVGMASLWVNQRRKQIGVRRAIGARKADILRYFLVENLMITTAGIAVGLAMAVGLNNFLVSELDLPRLPVAYLGLTMVGMWVLGLLAVLGPAWRAAASIWRMTRFGRSPTPTTTAVAR